MHYKLVKQLKDDNTLRKSFIDLAIKTFDLSFDAVSAGILERILYPLRFR